MKTRIIFYIITVIWASVTFGCSNGDETMNEITKEFIVSFNLTGEITTKDSPICITRASTETTSTDLYALQILKKENGTTSYQPFAYGFFDTLENVHAYLRNDGKYKIILTYLKDGKNIVFAASWGAYRFHDIYIYKDNSNTPYLNNIVYTNNSNYYSKLKTNGVGSYSKGNEFYGEVNDYEPTKNGTIDIEMRHCGFGLQYEITGLTDGSVDLTVKNENTTFINETSISSDTMSDPIIFSFTDLYSAWLYANNYSENVTISIQWKRGFGITQDLGSKTVQVKRNQMNIIHVKLGANDGSAQIGIETEDDNSIPTENITISLPAS